MAERAWTACRCRSSGFPGSPSTSRSTTSPSRRRNAAARLRSRARRETPREQGQGAVPVALVASQARFGEGPGCAAGGCDRSQGATGHGRTPRCPVGSEDGIAARGYAQGTRLRVRGFLASRSGREAAPVRAQKTLHDPHFNVMDGLDTYIDDYSKPDPIPEEMLKSLKQANRLLFPEDAAERDREIEAETARAAAAAGSTPAADAPPLQVADDPRMVSEPESPPTRDSKPPAKPAW